MRVQSLKNICRLTLAQCVVREDSPSINTDLQWLYLMYLLDHGSWGDESKKILDKVVEYYGHKVTPKIVEALLPCTAKDVSLKECPKVTEQCVDMVISRCTNLQLLDLTENPALIFNKIQLFQLKNDVYHHHLTTLMLEDCPQVSDAEIQALLRKAPSLQTLNIARCNITDNVFLVNEIKQLARETFFQMSSFTDDYDSKLQTVDVSRCKNFSSTGVRYLCTLCGPSLSSVNLSWTKVDCTSLLYLSGYGLPAAVQFYRSFNFLNNPMVEGLLIVLQKFDLVTQYITNQWQGKGTVGNPTKAAEVCVDHSMDKLSVTEAAGFDTAQTKGAGKHSTTHAEIGGACTWPNIFLALDSLGFRDKTERKCEISVVHNKSEVLTGDNKITADDDPIFPFCQGNYLLASNSGVSAPLSSNQSDSREIVLNDGVHSPAVICSEALESSSHADISEFAAAFTEKTRLVTNITNSVIGEEAIKFDFCELCDSYVFESMPLIVCEHKRHKTDHQSKDKQDSMDTFLKPPNGSVVTADSYSNRTFDLYQQDIVKNTEKLLESSEEPHCGNRKSADISSETSSTNSGNGARQTRNEDFWQRDERKKTFCFRNEFVGNKSTCGSNEMTGFNSSKIFWNRNSSIQTSDTLKGDNCSFSDNSFELFGYHTQEKPFYTANITSLCINGTIFEDEDMGIECFKKFIRTNCNLLTLKLFGGLTGNYVSDNVMEAVGTYGHCITCISIEGCDHVTSVGVTHLVKCKHLTVIDLTGVAFVDDPGIMMLVHSHPLSRLLLAETRITSTALNTIVTRPISSELKDLDLSWCEDLGDDDGLNNVVNTCSSLERLMLRECVGMTAQTLELLAEGCHLMTELSIASNMNIVLDDSVILLSENMPLLEKIDLGWNSHLTNKAIHALMKNCTHLKSANLEGLKQITSAPFVKIIAVPDALTTYLERLVEPGKDAEKCIIFPKIVDLPCLPHRSTVYCTQLHHLHLKYSDYVEDDKLQEIVAITQGSIQIVDYYGEEVEEIPHAVERFINGLFSSIVTR